MIGITTGIGVAPALERSARARNRGAGATGGNSDGRGDGSPDVAGAGAIAAAGGFQTFAKRKKIYILRTGPDGREQRIPFNYTEVIKGKRPEQNITLQARDIIIVP